MDVRREWVSQDNLNNGYSQFYTSEETISEAKENFDIRRYHSSEGYSITVNDTSTEQVLIQWYTNPLNGNREDIKIHFAIDSIITTGSLITWNSKKYLVAAKVKNNQAYKSSQMLECNNTLNFYNQSNDWCKYEIPCIVLDKLSASLTETKYITEPKCDIVVIVQANDTTNMIKVNDIYKIGRSNFLIKFIDDISKPNILLFFMEFTSTEQVIPDDEEPSDSGVSYIISGVDEIVIGDTQTYSVQKYINSVEAEGSFTLSIVNGSTPVSTYLLTVVDGNECTIKCNTAGYSIKLHAVDNSNPEGIIEKEIYLANLF